MAETNLSWPGERYPTRLDVEDAYKVPEPSFLRDFKQALIARDIARGYQHASSPGPFGQLSQSPVYTSGRANDGYSSRQFTYPLAHLSNFPEIPDVEQLRILESSFWALSKHILFLRAISMPSSSRDLSPPYVQLSSACLASCLSSSSEVSAALSERTYASRACAARSLFVAGLKVWGVMLEVDNREARKFEAVMACALLASYGTLSAEALLWSEVTVLLGYTGSIVRRLHMHDFCAQIDKSTLRNKNSATTRSRCSLMSYLFLVDVIRTIHHNTSPQFSRSELFISMPASDYNFYDIYTRLVDGEHALPVNMTEAEDAVLLLSALLSDIVMIQRVFSSFDLRPVELPPLQQTASSDSLPILSPFVPFSPVAENQSMLTHLSKGLDLWSERFKDIVPENILALFYFCRLCLSYPQVLSLSLISKYKPAVDANSSRSASTNDSIAVPEDAMRFVWLIVDHVNLERLPNRTACPLWLPVITYLTALVVWAHLRSSSSSQAGYGTLKTLSLFKVELQQMPWPCCTEMIKNLDDLMRVRS